MARAERRPPVWQPLALLIAGLCGSAAWAQSLRVFHPLRRLREAVTPRRDKVFWTYGPQGAAFEAEWRSLRRRGSAFVLFRPPQHLRGNRWQTGASNPPTQAQ